MNPTTGPHSRWEWPIIAGLTLLGLGIRAWDLGRLGILHFDEGMYGLAGLWIHSSKGIGGLDPGIAFYAPPVLPSLIGLMYLLLGVSDTAAVLVSILVGTLAIPVAAWLGRRAFGPSAAVCAAALVACQGAHVAFSRVALTDATFVTLLLLALMQGVRLLEQPGVLGMLWFGLAVGLAQLTKYNGFLAGVAVAAAAVAPLVTAHAAGRMRALRGVLWVAGAAVVALVVYFPWYQFVQTRVPGGYAALVRHHQGYLSPVSHWPLNALTQWAEAISLSGNMLGVFSWLLGAWPLAWVCKTLAERGMRQTETDPPADSRRALVVLAAGTVALGLFPDMPWWLALVAVPLLTFKPNPAQRVLGAAVLIFGVLTPFYHPYARLALPFGVLSQVVLAGWLTGLCKQPDFWLTFAGKVTLPRQIAVLAAVLAVPLFIRPLTGAWPLPAPGILAPSDHLRWLALKDEFKPTAKGNQTEQIYVYGRPSLLFYLNMRGQTQVTRIADEKQLNAIGPPAAGSAGGRGPYTVIIDGALLGANPVTERVPWSLQKPIHRTWNKHNWVTLLDLDPRLAFHPDRYNDPNHPADRPSEEYGEDPRLLTQSQLYIYSPTEPTDAR